MVFNGTSTQEGQFVPISLKQAQAVIMILHTLHNYNATWFRIKHYSYNTATNSYLITRLTCLNITSPSPKPSWITHITPFGIISLGVDEELGHAQENIYRRTMWKLQQFWQTIFLYQQLIQTEEPPKHWAVLTTTTIIRKVNGTVKTCCNKIIKIIYLKKIYLYSAINLRLFVPIFSNYWDKLV